MARLLKPPTFCSLLIWVLASNAAKYSRTESLSGKGFLKAFSHQAIPDPTLGRVNYLSEADALAQNLTFTSDDTFIMRADSKKTLDPTGPGRDSVRIQSNKQYSTHVIIMDVRHMPEGCGTWPAAWEVGEDWPNNGEVDIIEGINGVPPNQATLHTSPGCTMPGKLNQTGSVMGTDCNAMANENAGCGVTFNGPDSFAAGFNSIGGGWYTMERTDTAIAIWFWARNDKSVPDEVRKGPTHINTSEWGLPVANFTNSQCDLAAKFGPNNIVINLTFCSALGAGPFFSSAGCGDDCNAFVEQNPGAFVNAFWDFASLKVYE